MVLVTKLLVLLGSGSVYGAATIGSICGAIGGGMHGRIVGTFGGRIAGTFGGRIARGVGDGIWIHCDRSTVNVY